MPAKFLLFDAFGTLLRIPNGRPPYHPRKGERQELRMQANDMHQVTARHLGLA